MKLSSASYYLILVFVLVSCDGGEPEPDPDDKPISRMLIQDAQNLFIASGSKALGNGRSKEEPQRLYKITEDGLIIEVKYVNDDGDTLEHTLTPRDVIDVNNNYLIVLFSDFNVAEVSEGFLVDKSAERVFSLKNIGFPSKLNVYNYPVGNDVSTDPMGNIYYRTYFGEVIKIDTHDPANLTKTTYSAQTDKVDYYWMDGSGNMSYQGVDKGNFKTLRFKEATGQIHIIPGEPNGSVRFWSGPDGKFYYFNKFNASGFIQKITLSPFTLSNYGTTGFPFFGAIQGLLHVTNKNKILTVNETQIAEFYNAEGNPKEIPISLFGITKIKLSAVSNDHYFLVGTGATSAQVLLKIDPETQGFTKLLESGGYDIYSLNASPLGEVVFNALRLADGKIVLARISVSGEIQIITSDLENEVTVLERIL